jgi:hypothetical protein
MSTRTPKAPKDTIRCSEQVVVLEEPRSQIDDALAAVPPRLEATLAGLAGAPDGVAELTLSALPRGSRGLLEELKATERLDGDVEPRQVVLTDFGWQLMRAAAARQTHRMQEIDSGALNARVAALLEMSVSRAQ